MNQTIAQLLSEGLATGQETPGIPADVLAALQSSGQLSDPWLAMLTAMMARNAASDEKTVELADTQRRLGRARQVIRSLQKSLEAANAFLSYVGDTFGACPVCWGQDPHCQQCHGHGAPGGFRPNEAELLAWVTPALDRLNLQVVPKSKRPVAEAEPPLEERRQNYGR